MKLLYITNGINGSGGLERVLSVKASALAEDYGYEVCILCLNDAHLNPFYSFSPKIKMLSIVASGNPISYFKQYKQGIQKVVDEFQPVVISVCDDGLKGFFIPQFLKTKAKIIYERHVSKLIEARDGQSLLKKTATKGKWFLMEQLAQRFSKFVVLTEGNKKEWKSLQNMMVIANPLSFYPEESSSLENKKVICVGKISYQKGQDILLEAWNVVHEKHPDWKLELYGKANDAFLKVQNLEGKNVFYFPPEKNIEEKYLQSSVYVMSSRFEGFGMVLIEAMACGVPCVSFDCDYGPSDIITDGEDGFLVEKENEMQLADKILFLIENEELRKGFGQKAKENSKRYSVSEIVQQWDDLFKKLVK